MNETETHTKWHTEQRTIRCISASGQIANDDVSDALFHPCGTVDNSPNQRIIICGRHSQKTNFATAPCNACTRCRRRTRREWTGKWNLQQSKPQTFGQQSFQNFPFKTFWNEHFENLTLRNGIFIKTLMWKRHNLRMPPLVWVMVVSYSYAASVSIYCAIWWGTLLKVNSARRISLAKNTFDKVPHPSFSLWIFSMVQNRTDSSASSSLTWVISILKRDISR